MLGEIVLNIILDKSFDWSKEKIKEVLSHKKDESAQKNYQTMMYQVVVDTLNKLTFEKYRGNQDIIYQATEILINNWLIYGHLGLEVVCKCLYTLEIFSEEKYNDFIYLLEKEICENKTLKDYYAIDVMTNSLIGINNANKAIEELHEKINKMGIEKTLEKKSFENTYIMDKFYKNQKQKYIDKWNARLFLHQRMGDKELKLNNTFVWPAYQVVTKSRLGKTGTRDAWRYNNLKERLLSFLNCRKGVQFILGQPGMGKTSIIAWLANKYVDSDELLILRFCDWNEESIAKGTSLLALILHTLNCEKEDLNGKILVLDGFDELRFHGEKERLIKIFLMNISGIDLRVIITSRPNYINMLRTESCIELLPFRKKQIRQFYHKMCGEKMDYSIAAYGVEVLGIPVILYMAISTGIDLRNVNNRCEMYEKIFSLNGGIFDRFSNCKNDGYEREYHSIAYVKEKFHLILQELAFTMFDKRTDKMADSDYIRLVKKYVGDNESIINDFPIKNLYEENQGIEFVHRSIYEFFAAEYIYKRIEELLREKHTEIISREMAIMISNSLLSDEKEILEYLSYKVRNNYILKEEKYDIIKAAFNEMLEKGFLFFTQECWEGAFDKEIKVFLNMLDILRLWNEKIVIRWNLNMEKYIWASIGAIASFINLSKVEFQGRLLDNINLIAAELTEVDIRASSLKGAKLNRANLSEANLAETDLSGADLSSACLIRTDLCGADLREANLVGVDLRGADLRRADLTEACLIRADFVGARLESSVWKKAILEGAKFDTQNIHFLEKYCDRKQLSEVIVSVKNINNSIKMLSYDEFKAMVDIK